LRHRRAGPCSVLSWLPFYCYLMRLLSVFRPGLTLLLGGALSLLSSCREICDTDNLPQYPLTTGQHAWVAPFADEAVWRFRNANGYERTYRITETKTESEGGGKSSFCSRYYTQYAYAKLVRTDSTSSGLETIYLLQLTAANETTAKGFSGYIQWGSANFRLPIDEVEDGRRVLPAATFAGRTYPQVLESTYAPLLPEKPRPMMPARIYLTKTEGVIRVEEYGGTVWDRVL
jgi:hypothetical protein